MSIENELKNDEQSIRKIGQNDARGNRNLKLKIVFLIVTVIVWGGLFYGGYLYAFNYFEENYSYLDEQIQEVKIQNQEVVAQLDRFNEELQNSTEELLLIRTELNVINEGLTITGETLSGSDDTRVAIHE